MTPMLSHGESMATGMILTNGVRAACVIRGRDGKLYERVAIVQNPLAWRMNIMEMSARKAYFSPLLMSYLISSQTVWLSFGPRLPLPLIPAALLRLGALIALLWLSSWIPCMLDLAAYHGAEHMVLNSHGDLRIATVRASPRYHPNCSNTGTALGFLVAAFTCSAIPFGGFRGALLRIVTTLLLEHLFMYLVKRHRPRWSWLYIPGRVMQHFTTREPEDRHLELAIHAARLCLKGGKKRE